MSLVVQFFGTPCSSGLSQCQLGCEISVDQIVVDFVQYGC